MTFGADHYIPVLKVKRAEKSALRELAPEVARRATPLLEVVVKTGAKTLAQHLKTTFDGLAVAVERFPGYFLDAVELTPTGSVGAEQVFAQAAQIGVPFVPVTGISRTVDVPAALAAAQHGLALRLTRDDFEADRVAAGADAFLSAHKRAPANIDLIVDLGSVAEMVVAGVVHMMDRFLAMVPQPTAWRTLTVVGSAFPKSMGEVGRDAAAQPERSEWVAWRDSFHARRQNLVRLPTFGDWAIQHPAGVEGFDPRTMAVSAAIRYALEDTWLLIKGHSTRVTPPSVQFPRLAKKLVTGTFAALYQGANHCKGCADAELAANGAPGFGSAEAWRRLGTIHHITNTVRQIGALPLP